MVDLHGVNSPFAGCWRWSFLMKPRGRRIEEEKGEGKEGNQREKGTKREKEKKD